MEQGTGSMRGGGLAPSPRTMERLRLEQLTQPGARISPVFENAPAAVIALRETMKAIHFQHYGYMIDLFDLLAQSERQGEVLHRRGMKILHDHLDAMDTAMRSILIKGEVPAELTAAVNRQKEKQPARQEEANGDRASTDAER